MNRGNRLVIGLALAPAFLVGALILLRTCGLVRPFSVPTGAMSPAICAGDGIIMEGMTFLSRQPRRGDIVVFKSDGIPSLRPAKLYVQRIAGEPGDHVRISEGRLFINDKQVSLSNTVGEIAYCLPPQATIFSPQTNVTVPSGHYFLLGDNSANSFDSRFWGGIPRGNIIGRASFCYGPPKRVGTIR